MNTAPELQSVPLPWQQETWRRLCARLADGTLPHALLISGVAGTGKQLFAQAFAMLALCQHSENQRACGCCGSCRQFSAGAHPDYFYVAMLEDRSAILVDQIRELSQSLTLTSQYGGRKIAVLVPADAMNANAVNSLLKTLEEPPADTLLLLVTARPARLAATARSRCQDVHLPSPDRATVLQWLNSREPRHDWPALLDIAGGGPLAALSLARYRPVQERLQFYTTLVELRNGRRNPMACAAGFDRETLPVILRLLQSWVMDLIVLASAGDTGRWRIVNTDALDLLQSVLKGINLRALHAYLEHLNEAVALIATPVNTQLLLEGLFLEWADGLRTLETAPLAACGGQFG